MLGLLVASVLIALGQGELPQGMGHPSLGRFSDPYQVVTVPFGLPDLFADGQRETQPSQTATMRTPSGGVARDREAHDPSIMLDSWTVVGGHRDNGARPVKSKARPAHRVRTPEPALGTETHGVEAASPPAGNPSGGQAEASQGRTPTSRPDATVTYRPARDRRSGAIGQRGERAVARDGRVKSRGVERQGRAPQRVVAASQPTNDSVGRANPGRKEPQAAGQSPSARSRSAMRPG